jgi:hypothetical protein
MNSYLPLAPAPAAALSRAGIFSVLIAALAIASAFGALMQVLHSDRLVAEVEVQTVVAEAYQSRAIHCLDLARAWIEDDDRRPLALMSLNISKGITFCLVRARDHARLEVEALTDCTREVEAAGTVLDHGDAVPHPVC